MPFFAVAADGRYNPPGRTGRAMSGSSKHDEGAAANDRLESWKEIAGYLKRDVTTVQRWEKREGMPVHRHLHDKAGSVHALRRELDAWARRRTVTAELTAEPQHATGVVPPLEPAAETATGRRLSLWSVVVAVCLIAAITAIFWRMDRADAFWKNPLANATFARVTDSDSAEQAAAISRDGRFVAFLSDRDGPVDVWVTQVGTGQFYNLSHNNDWELVNPSLRSLGFSPDDSLVTFWTRTRGGSASDINIWAVPILGGPPRPYLEGAAEVEWSRDGSRVVYHTPGPGDPMFVTDAPRAAGAPPIFTAPAGLHSHFPMWSPDHAFIYFVQGSLPDHMDVWRIRPTGGAPERITHHDSRVSHPVFLNARTLLYLATDESGAGPRVYSMDVNRRTPHRVSAGVDRYTSLAASADGERLVATLATTRTTFLRLTNLDAGASVPEPSRIRLTTGSGSSPR